MQAQVQFEDVTNSAGFTYWGESWGASWGDLNGDGWPDIFVNHHRAPPSLHVNQGNGQFQDITASTYWNNPGVIGDMHGGSWADFDNDGDQDFYVTHGSKNANHFMVNVNGVLNYQTPQYDLLLSSWRARLPVWFDFSGDGLLDVLVTSENTAPVAEQGPASFANRTAAAGIDCNKRQMAYLVDVTGDGALDLICTGATFPGRIYDIRLGVPFNQVNGLMQNTWSTQDVAVGDFDNNLKNDFFLVRGAKRLSGADQVGNNTVAAQLITIGGGEKRASFVSDGDVTITLVVERAFSGQDVAIGATGWNPNAPVTKSGGERRMVLNLSSSDPDVVGIQPHNPATNRDVFIGYDPTTQTWTIINSPGGLWTFLSVEVTSTSPVSNVTATGLNSNDRPIRPALISNGAGGFSDITNAAGLSAPIVCVSTVTADFDNDMDMDIYAVCRGANFNVANRYFDNDGNGGFTEVPLAGGAAGPVGAGVGKGESVVTADYDVDGNVDLFVTNGLALNPERIGGPDLLFRNLGHPTNSWLQFDLVGTVSNRDGIGARVLVEAAGKTQLREQGGGYHRWSQNDKRLHFGLGANTTANVTVEWPSGVIDVYPNVAANAVYTVNEGGTIDQRFGGGPPPPVVSISPPATSNPEGSGSVELAIELSASAASAVTVNYATIAGSAAAGTDFVAVTDSVVFSPGEVSKPINISVVDDAIPEPDEAFTVELVGVSGPATLGASIATLTVENDDGPFAGLSIGDAAANEDSGTLDFTVTLTEAVVGNVAFTASTADGTATAATGDYSPLVSAPGIIAEGDTSTTVSVAMGADSDVEPNENFTVTLVLQSGSAAISDGTATGTINNDDVPPPALSIADTSAVEDDGVLVFDVTLSEAVVGSVDFTVSTTDGTATVSDSDYTALVAVAGSIAEGETATTVAVDLGVDSTIEPNEDFTATLTLIGGSVVVGDGTATGTIINDDPDGAPVDTPVTDWRNHQGNVTTTGNQISFASALDTGWSHQVNSVPLVDLGFADGYEVRFEVVGDPTTSLWLIGLGVSESGSSRTDVDFAFRNSNGSLQIRQNGDWLSSVGPVTSGDILSLYVSSGTLEYRVNGTPVFLSTVADPASLYVDSAFRRGSIAIEVTVAGDAGSPPPPPPPPPGSTDIVDWVNAAGGVTAINNNLTFSGSPPFWLNSINSVPLTSLGAGSSFTVSWTVDSIPVGANWVVGLGVAEAGPSRTDVDYGLRNAGGSLQVRQNGNWLASAGVLAQGDTLGIRVTDTTLEYLLNGASVYSLPISGTESFYIDSAFKNGTTQLGSFMLTE